MLVCLFCMVRMFFSVPWFGAFLPHSRGLENHAKYADHEGAGSGLPVGLPGEPRLRQMQRALSKRTTRRLSSTSRPGQGQELH